jgi:hypothetical protein
MKTMRTAALLCVVSVFSAAPAAAADLITIAGSAARALPAAQGIVRFPAKITAGTTVAVVDVTLDGGAVGSPGVTASIDRDQFLAITITADSAREAGTYTVIVAARGGDNLQLLPLTLTRPAGDIRIATGPVRMTRTVYAPYVACIRSNALTMNNVARYAAVTPAQKQSTADLRSADNVTVGRVTVDVPDRIEPLKSALAHISVDVAPPLGTATATLRIAAPQLAGGAFEQSLELVSRLSLWWLFLTIAVGIGAGYLCRVVLEKTRLRADALLAANAQREILQELIRKTPDAEDVAALQGILTILETAMADPRTTPEDISTATKGAVGDAQKVVNDANAVRTAAAAKLDELQARIGPAGGHVPAIKTAIADTSRQLENLRQALAAGESNSVRRALTTLESDLDTRFEPLTDEWVAEIATALDGFVAWPEVPHVAEAIAAARATLASLPADLHGRLNAIRQLATSLRADLFGASRRAIANAALTRLSALAPAQPATVAKVAAARAAAELVPDWNGEPAGEALDKVVAALRNLRELLDAAVQAVPPPVTETVLKGGQPPAKPIPPQDFAIAVGEAADEPPPTIARIVVNGPAVAGLPLSFRIVSATNALPPIARVNWTANGNAIATGSAITVTTSPAAGFLTVAAEIEFADGLKATANASLQILPPPQLPSADVLLARRRKAELIQTAVAGLLITLGGLFIFKNSFVGTFDDLGGAFLWGFGTDIGLTKLREMTLPLLQRTVPVPKA